MTLRFLATGESQQSLSFSFRIGKSTISSILSETSKAIYDSLQYDFLKVPSSNNEWLAIANAFEKEGNIPHCIGVIDGKQIRVECPKLTGTQYYNYKGFFKHRFTCSL